MNTEELKAAADEAVEKRNEALQTYRRARNDTDNAHTLNDAQAIQEARQSRVSTGDALVALCAAADDACAKYGEAVLEYFSQADPAARAKIRPLQVRLNALREEVGEVERQLRIEVEAAQPEINSIGSVRSNAQTWITNQGSISRELALWVHDPSHVLSAVL
jgi:hypothetical protein